MTRQRGAWRLLLVVPALALILSACSSGSTDQVATLSGDSASASATPTLSAAQREQMALQFSQCMRKNGVPNFPDPTVDQNGNLVLRPPAGIAGLSTGDLQTLRTAFQACSQYAEGLRAGFSGQDRQQMEDAILAFAQCMRANGYNMPDPQFGSQPSAGASPGDGGPFGSINRNDPAFQKAFSACQDKLPGFGGRGLGGGPSASSSP